MLQSLKAAAYQLPGVKDLVERHRAVVRRYFGTEGAGSAAPTGREKR